MNNVVPSRTSVTEAQAYAALLARGLTDKQLAWELPNNKMTAVEMLAFYEKGDTFAAVQARRPAASQPSARAAPPPVTAAAPAPPPAGAPPRAPWTAAQMDERVRRIVQSPLSAGRKELAIHLCSSAFSIDQALDVMKASAADTATSAPDMAAEIFARRRADAARARGEPPVADQPASTAQLDANEIFARRRAAAATYRGTAIGAPAASLAGHPTGKPTLNANAIFAARRAACRQARQPR